MATRATLRTELGQRLADTSNVVWTTSDVNGYLDFGIKSLYPHFFQRYVNTTTATVGPVQTGPAGVRNLYMIALQNSEGTRVRPLRGWTEGSGTAFVPRLNIAGQTLVWSWTDGWDAPASDSTTLTIPKEAEEVVIVRAQIAAYEHLLASRTKQAKYFAIQVREAVTEDELATIIDSLRGSVRDLLDGAIALPEVIR